MSPLPAIPAISQEFLIVGEGKGDASFFAHLCDVKGINGFQIEQAGGTGKLSAYLSGLRSRTNFDQLRAILVARDCDDGPTESFNEVAKYLKKAKLPSPYEPLKLKRNPPAALAVVIMMLPFTVAGGPTKGCLESLLLPAIESHRPAVKTCVDAYSACLGRNLSKNFEHKFRVRCSIAAMWPDDPNFGLQYALDPGKDMIPLNHAVFDEVTNFLINLPAMCEA